MAEGRYFRLSKADRIAIERGLDKRESGRRIARDIGRSNSTVHDEVLGKRIVVKGPGRGEAVSAVPDDACPRLLSWPHVCNGCRYRRCHCARRWRCECSATRAQALSDELRADSRRRIDAEEGRLEHIAGLIRSDLDRGLSPEQICASRASEIGVHPSTVRRWIAKGVAGMSDMELRRKVGYRPRRKAARPKPTSHGAECGFEAFCALGDAERARACEMDCVVGLARDRQCLLTLYLRACRLQLAVLLPEKTSAAVVGALDALEKAIGGDAFADLFGLILTDNGAEFSDRDSIERSASQAGGRRCRLYYCDVRQSQQKAGCERNHVELRKILPKGRGISFDDLDCRDCAVLMSHLNSEPRPSLMGMTPMGMLRAAMPERADALFAAYGMEEVGYGDLRLTPDALNEERGMRGLAPLI